MIVCEIEERKIGVNSVIHIRAVGEHMTERHLEYHRGHVVPPAKVCKKICASVSGVIGIKDVKGDEGGCVPLAEVLLLRAVGGVHELTAGKNLLAFVG